MSVSEEAEKIRGLSFYPLDFSPRLRGNGIGQAAYFLLLEKAVLDLDIGLHYELEESVEAMSPSCKNMMGKMGVFNFGGCSNEDVFRAPVAPLLAQVQEYLKGNGYDVEALIENGIDPF